MMDYKELTIEDIIKWCQENNQVEWLKAKAQETVEYKVYPRKKVVNEKGLVVSVADKDKEPTIKSRPISFVQIKSSFRDTFLKEEMPRKTVQDKPNMYDMIANL